METGYEETPYVKGSKRKSVRKGTGKGVCAETGKKHDKLWVYGVNLAVTGHYWDTWGSRWACILRNYCVDCGKYREQRYIRAETLRKCRENVESFTGQAWDKILYVQLTEADRIARR